jgi:hypothetical protein
MALEATHRLYAALAFGFLSLQVSTRRRVAASACDRDDVQRPVDLPVTPTIEAMPVFAP